MLYWVVVMSLLLPADKPDVVAGFKTRDECLHDAGRRNKHWGGLYNMKPPTLWYVCMAPAPQA